MKATCLSCTLPFVLTARLALAQGTLVFDQQSSDELNVQEGGVQFLDHPVQSFTPALTTVGFFRLYFIDCSVYNGRINLRATSPSGPIIGTTLPIITSRMTGPVTLFFPAPVPVTPETLYYFELSADTGGGTLNAFSGYNYPRGTLVGTTWDMWFREGIIVPEPTIATLLLLAVPLFLRSRSVRRVGACKTPSTASC